MPRLQEGPGTWHRVNAQEVLGISIFLHRLLWGLPLFGASFRGAHRTWLPANPSPISCDCQSPCPSWVPLRTETSQRPQGGHPMLEPQAVGMETEKGHGRLSIGRYLSQGLTLRPCPECGFYWSVSRRDSRLGSALVHQGVGETAGSCLGSMCSQLCVLYWELCSGPPRCGGNCRFLPGLHVFRAV